MHDLNESKCGMLGRGSHLIGLFLFLLAVVQGCGSADRSSDVGKSKSSEQESAPRSFTGEYPIRIVCTTGMVADAVKRVGGKHVEVTSLMGPGVDPHLYKASTGDISRLEAADMVFYSGLHLEGKMADILERLDRRKPSIALAEQIDDAKRIKVGEEVYDPHVWFDVSLWQIVVQAAGEELASFDSKHADDYHRETSAYVAELKKLDDECRQQLASIEVSQRVLVTAHDAFSYFGRAYQVEVRAIQGVSTDSEAGLKTINELVNFIVSRKIKAVFVESSVSEHNIRALVEGCVSQGHDLQIGGELFSDAMGNEGTPEGSYPGMVRHNVSTIVQALH